MFKRLSIQKKIALIIVSISFFTFSTGGFFFLHNLIQDLKNTLESSAIKNAELFAEYSIVPLAFSDNYQAEKNMEILRKVPSVEAAVLFDVDSNQFAQYTKSNTQTTFHLPEDIVLPAYSDDFYIVSTPVQKDGQQYGSITIWVSTQSLRNDIKQNIIIFIFTLFILLVVAFGLASVFQRVITSPVLKLAEVMERITSEHDFSTRVEHNSYDEIGKLYDGFNKMIEEIHLAQVDLLRSESKFKSYIESAPDGIFVINRTGKITEINAAATQITRLKRDALLGQNIDTLLPSFPITTKVTQLFSLPPESQSITFDTEYISPDNKIFYWSASVIRLKDDHLLGFFKDITIRKNSEFEVHRLQNYLLNIIDSMPSVIIAIDYQLTITQWNQKAEEYSQIKRKNALGRNIKEVIPSLAIALEDLDRAPKLRFTPTQKKRRLLVNGTERYENLTIYPLSNERSGGAVIRIDDITEMVKLEEMMIQSEKMLSVGGLAAGMAHEINNPLAGMIQNANLIQSRLTGKLPSNVSAAKEANISLTSLQDYLQKRDIIKQLQMITDSGIRAARIVQNMLSFSRKSESTNLLVDMTSLIDNTIELAQNDYMLKKKFDFRNIKIIRQYSANLPKVRCDDSKIQQVLLNLLKNGAHAMASKKQDGYKPSFTFKVYSEQDSLVTIIADNGPGMDHETQKRIFEPFYTTKSVGEGSGLGLSVSYFIIKENHNGDMRVESQPGEGTQFIIKLPLN